MNIQHTKKITPLIPIQSLKPNNNNNKNNNNNNISPTNKDLNVKYGYMYDYEETIFDPINHSPPSNDFLKKLLLRVKNYDLINKSYDYDLRIKDCSFVIE
jgi:hypothetical protein